MAEVILVTGGRGGVGKTTVCALLGQALAEQGKSVLLFEGAQRSLDVLFDVSDRLLFDLSDVEQGSCVLSDAIIPLQTDQKLCLLCAPVEGSLLPDEAFCRTLMAALDRHFDYILIEVDGLDAVRLTAYAAAADRAVLVSTADRVSARACRTVSDLLFAQGIADIRLCINLLSKDFVRQRPVPDLDWMIDQICAQLICIIPFERSLISISNVGETRHMSNSAKIIFDNFAQRIMGNYIDLLVQ